MPAVNTAQYTPISTRCPSCGVDCSSHNRAVKFPSWSGHTTFYGSLRSFHGYSTRYLVVKPNRALYHAGGSVKCTACNHDFGLLSLRPFNW